jgi:hypothetical protein
MAIAKVVQPQKRPRIEIYQMGMDLYSSDWKKKKSSILYSFRLSHRRWPSPLTEKGKGIK